MSGSGERGAASLYIELRGGVIKVWHGTDRDWLLAEKTTTRIGDWNRLTEALQLVGIKWIQTRRES